jgi:hypothetical protein
MAQGHVALAVLGTEKRKGSPLTDRQPRLGDAARRRRRTCQFSAEVSLRVLRNRRRLLFRRALELGTQTCGEAITLSGLTVIATKCCAHSKDPIIRRYLKLLLSFSRTNSTNHAPGTIDFFTKAQAASCRRSQRRRN